MKIRELKLLALLIMTMCLLLSGCTDTANEGDIEKEQLVIGSDMYSPYFYLGDDGAFTGIDVDIATEACNRLGLTPVFRQIGWQDKDEYLADRTIDCLWGCFTMNGREDEYTWAGPYMYSKQIVVVNADSHIFSLSDLNGRTVAVQNASKPERIFLTDGIDGVSAYKVYSFANLSNAFAALKKGYVDACAGHEMACRDYIRNSSSDAYRILDEILLKANIGVAFDKSAGKEKAEKLSAVLNEMYNDGTLRKILEKYDMDVEFALNGGGLR